METQPERKVATREAYGNTLLKLGEERDDVVVLDADLSGSTKTKAFSKAFPQRFFNIGVAEANMMGTAAGLAAMGKTVFASSFAMFASGKAWEQVRQSICVPDLNVKICATHAGLTVGEDGKSHQMLEDLALMRVLPHMSVIVPADATEAEKAVRAVAAHKGPVYVRLSRAATPVIFGDDHDFQIGRGQVLQEGQDVALIACGVEVTEALDAAQVLGGAGISARVVNMPTIKPIDRDLVLDCARSCGAILTVEEHQRHGGLGSAVAEVVVESSRPVPMELVGVDGTFGESAPADVLLEKYGLKAKTIAQKATELIQRKA